MLLVEGSSETGLVRDLSNTFFGVRNFENKLALRIICFLWKRSKLNVDVKNADKNSGKVFLFLR